MASKAKDRLVEAHVSGQSNEPMTRPAHALSFDQVIDELHANIQNGLTEAEAEKRLEKYGKNELGEAAGAQPIKIVIAQIANAMTLVSLQNLDVLESNR